jgi:hypothetical protein
MKKESQMETRIRKFTGLKHQVMFEIETSQKMQSVSKWKIYIEKLLLLIHKKSNKINQYSLNLNFKYEKQQLL